MVRIVPNRPWTEPLNWDRFVTEDGETCMPFAHYVRPDTACATHAVFQLFPRLPLELQLRVLRLCTYATLFQLMHASPATRTEAEKLFWSNPAAWYHVSGEWLLAGGFAGHTHDATNLLVNVQRVEINFRDIESFTRDFNDGESAIPPDSPSWTLAERVHSIWRLL
ncbi:hypothetical protein GQ44DRAFT_628312, partial [Phaeosphaeriaceae sp. PMI808]